MNQLLDELKALLVAALAAKFTTIYKGEVAVVPRSYLPALMIWPSSTKLIAKTTTQDQYTYEVNLRAVVDLNKYLDEDGTGDTIKAQEALTELMEARDTDSIPKNDSVLGVFRKVSNIGGVRYLYNNDVTITYKIIQTGEYFYCKAEMTLQFVTALINRPV